MDIAVQFLQSKLDERKHKGLLRELTTSLLPFDFCSNDYLGFANSLPLKQAIAQQHDHYTKNGAGGSRLLSGNYPFTEETEQFIAGFHQAAAGLLFNSGYDANVGLLAAVPQRGDTVISDELIHASLIDGARLSHATRYKFRHNDMADLEQLLKKAKGLCYVVVESVYSMDGDTAPLASIAALCQQYRANLIVDEAHATGVFGPNGEGLAVQLGLTDAIFARIVTFGKALGTHGAIVLGSTTLRNYLINFARSFIYTTAAPPHHIVAVRCAYQMLMAQNPVPQLKGKIGLYNALIKNCGLRTIQSHSAIQTVLCNGNTQARNLAKSLQEKGFDVRAILSPTVAEGKERLRICLHTYNSDEEIKNLVKLLQTLTSR